MLILGIVSFYHKPSDWFLVGLILSFLLRKLNRFNLTFPNFNYLSLGDSSLIDEIEEDQVKDSGVFH